MRKHILIGLACLTMSLLMISCSSDKEASSVYKNENQKHKNDDSEENIKDGEKNSSNFLSSLFLKNHNDDEAADDDDGDYLENESNTVKKVTVSMSVERWEKNRNGQPELAWSQEAPSVEFPLTVSEARQYVDSIAYTDVKWQAQDAGGGPWECFSNLCYNNYLVSGHKLDNREATTNSRLLFMFNSKYYDEYDWYYGDVSEAFCNCLNVQGFSYNNKQEGIRLIIDGEDYIEPTNDWRKTLDCLVEKLGRYEKVDTSGCAYYFWQLTDEIWFFLSDSSIYMDAGLVYTNN